MGGGGGGGGWDGVTSHLLTPVISIVMCAAMATSRMLSWWKILSLGLFIISRQIWHHLLTSSS